MTSIHTGRLEVPEASLHYQRRGSGPSVLLIHGGAGDADSYAELARELSAAYEVITYDRRGHSRSYLEGPQHGDWIGAHADDAHWLLETLTDEPAYVFGGSSGAVIALTLAIRHPEQLRQVVAHEPPLLQLLPDAAELTAMTQDTIAAYTRSGAEEAFAIFGPATGFTRLVEPEPGTQPVPFRQENVAFWFETELTTAPFATPDSDQLAELSDRIVVAGGEQARPHYPYRAAVALAERIGATFVEVPGTHVGARTHPRSFAVALAHIFSATRAVR